MFTKHTKIKKELGNWGENILDYWMEKNQWVPIKKNLKIKKGEIDRIYFYPTKNTTNTNKFCIAEIKTSFLHKTEDLELIQTEIGIKRYLKQTQIRNLYRYGENLIAQLNEKKIKIFEVYIRFFIIFKISNKKIIPLKKKVPLCGSLKICFQNNDCIIFSVEPEFTLINNRKSLLQTKI